jgi:hypothetical protein
MVNIHVGDSYALVEPYVPEELEKALTYWHKTFERDPQTFQMKVAGQVRKLYTLRTEGTAMSLTTLPGFVSQIRACLHRLGLETRIVDERIIKSQPDLNMAMVGLKEYQLEGVFTLVQSYGGVMGCPTGWGP